MGGVKLSRDLPDSPRSPGPFCQVWHTKLGLLHGMMTADWLLRTCLCPATDICWMWGWPRPTELALTTSAHSRGGRHNSQDRDGVGSAGLPFRPLPVEAYGLQERHHQEQVPISKKPSWRSVENSPPCSIITHFRRNQKPKWLAKPRQTQVVCNQLQPTTCCPSFLCSRNSFLSSLMLSGINSPLNSQVSTLNLLKWDSFPTSDLQNLCYIKKWSNSLVHWVNCVVMLLNEIAAFWIQMKSHEELLSAYICSWSWTCPLNTPNCNDNWTWTWPLSMLIRYAARHAPLDMHPVTQGIKRKKLDSWGLER